MMEVDPDHGHDEAIHSPYSMNGAQVQRVEAMPAEEEDNGSNCCLPAGGEPDADDDSEKEEEDCKKCISNEKKKKMDDGEDNNNENDESWNDYDEKGRWTVPEGAAMIVKQFAAEQIFWELVDRVVVADDDGSTTTRPTTKTTRTTTARSSSTSPRVNFSELANLIYQYPGLCHRTYTIQWDHENETRELYPLAILACLQPPSLELLQFVYQAYPPALNHRESVKGTLPFHYACTFRASLEVVDWMLQLDSNVVRISRTDGMYPLHLAIFFQSPTNVVNRLLQVWPEAAQQDYTGEWSILHAAAAGQASLDLVQRVYQLNPQSVVSLDERERTPLHQACWKRGNLPVIQFLVECAPHTLHLEDDSAETPLFRASRNQSLEVMQYLLTSPPALVAAAAAAAAANPDNRDNHPPHNHAAAAPLHPPPPPLDDLGATLLHFAALDNTEDVVEYLLQQHPEMALVQTRCRDRYTPLHSACHYSRGNHSHGSATASRRGFYKKPRRNDNNNNTNDTLDDSSDDDDNSNSASPPTSNLANFQALVRHCPQVLTMLNGDGKTPLETAEEVGSAEEVVEFLKQVTPPKKTQHNSSSSLKQRPAQQQAHPTL